jgi:ubiquinone/menaquinone biosynthesis C-methylase UbiE
MNSARFQDYFSRVSASYARFRPTYPSALFGTVARYAPALDCAWDCATGSGQAAIGLSRHFRQVIATDASSQQVQQATPVSNVAYRVALAEASGLDAGSVDAVTVAQALQWFDRDRFYAEVRRAGRPGAVLAVWFYAGRVSFNPEIDAVTEAIHMLFLKHWPPVYADLIQSMLHLDRPECREQLFSALAFPFDPLPAPSFELVVHWNLDQLIGALATSSAAQGCLASADQPRLMAFFEDLAMAWGEPTQAKTGVETLAVRLGRIS